MITYDLQDVNKISSRAILPLLVIASVMLHAWVVISAADAPLSGAKTDEQRLTGRWVRPDGGYILELKEVRNNGSLKAAYFNPRPIGVYHAEWNRKQGVITVSVELRDINYPGSTYNLQYDPGRDRLTGTYFQAVYGETYGIEFVRIK